MAPSHHAPAESNRSIEIGTPPDGPWFAGCKTELRPAASKALTLADLSLDPIQIELPSSDRPQPLAVHSLRFTLRASAWPSASLRFVNYGLRPMVILISADLQDAHAIGFKLAYARLYGRLHWAPTELRPLRLILARARPALTLSRMMPRSNSANTPSIWNIALPAFVDVSSPF